MSIVGKMHLSSYMSLRVIYGRTIIKLGSINLWPSILLWLFIIMCYLVAVWIHSIYRIALLSNFSHSTIWIEQHSISFSFCCQGLLLLEGNLCSLFFGWLPTAAPIFDEEKDENETTRAYNTKADPQAYETTTTATTSSAATTFSTFAFSTATLATF